MSPTAEYAVTLRLDFRRIPYYEALRDVTAWWAVMDGQPAPDLLGVANPGGPVGSVLNLALHGLFGGGPTSRLSSRQISTTPSSTR